MSLLPLLLLIQTTQHPVQPIEWHNSKYKVVYQTCGCADMCWSATLIESKLNKRIAKIRSDCEAVFFSKTECDSERRLSVPPDWFQSEDKFLKIKFLLETGTP